MSHGNISLMEKIVLDLFPDNLDGFKILDCGFGYGEWGLLIRTRKNGTPYLVGVDIFKPYCEKQKILRIYDEICCINASNIDKFLNTNFNIVIASELIEHLDKNDGLKLINKLEKICKEILIITSPKGPKYIGKIMGDNEYNTHLSEWSVKDFKILGFNIKTIDTRPLPKTIRFLDVIRRFLLNLDPVPQQIIAWKLLHNGRNIKGVKDENTSN